MRKKSTMKPKLISRENAQNIRRERGGEYLAGISHNRYYWASRRNLFMRSAAPAFLHFNPESTSTAAPARFAGYNDRLPDGPNELIT